MQGGHELGVEPEVRPAPEKRRACAMCPAGCAARSCSGASARNCHAVHQQDARKKTDSHSQKDHGFPRDAR